MSRAAGIITDHGGSTSHAAIVSRELGIPAVVGTGDRTAVLIDGTPVTLSCAEGEEGHVYRGVLPYERDEVDVSEIPATRTRLMVNSGIAKLAAPYHPSPVIVRMSDFKTNEYAHLLGGRDFEHAEENPMIGFPRVNLPTCSTSETRLSSEWSGWPSTQRSPPGSRWESVVRRRATTPTSPSSSFVRGSIRSRSTPTASCGLRYASRRSSGHSRRQPAAPRLECPRSAWHPCRRDGTFGLLTADPAKSN